METGSVSLHRICLLFLSSNLQNDAHCGPYAEVHYKAVPSDNNNTFILKVQEMLEALSNEWVAFQQCLIDSDAMLKKSKEKFKTGLLHSAEDLKKSVGSLQDDLNIKGAFSAKIPVDEVTIFCYY